MGSFSLCERMVDRMDRSSADITVVIQCLHDYFEGSVMMQYNCYET